MNRKTLIFEVQDLKKVYNQRNVLQIGRLQIHKGTIYGIVGPVGSGKTSLLKQLSGIEKPNEGKLLYDGNEFKTSLFGKLKTPDEIKFLSMTDSKSKESVSRFFTSNHGKRSEEIRKQYFNNGFRRFMWDQTVDTLSQGELKWIQHVDALESDPRVLIIDNYGSMLDDEMENDISNRLRRMNRNLGTTIVVSATNPARIQKLVSVMIFLDKGHIAKIRSASQNKRPQRNQGRQNQRRNRN
ncbi:MAG: ATP-binding cassette domain-containing protein [Candidatus Marinimicrobia bacterium]|nr:ATP-binding cassette domain-containing protein [Candidatus Neomarinimicrobiota bacterium]